jgi:hypothetical protein
MNGVLDSTRPVLACPACGCLAGRFLPHSSHAAVVDYYRCDECGELWTAVKEPLTAPVTTRPKRDRRSLPR